MISIMSMTLARPWLGVPTGAKLLRTEAKGGEMHLFVFVFFSEHAAICQRGKAAMASF